MCLFFSWYQRNIQGKHGQSCQTPQFHTLVYAFLISFPFSTQRKLPALWCAVAQPGRASSLSFERGLVSLAAWPLRFAHIRQLLPIKDQRKSVRGFLQTFPFFDKGRAPVYRINFVLVACCLHFEMSSWCSKCQLPSWDHKTINPNKKCQHVTGVKILCHTWWIRAWKYVFRISSVALNNTP